jgi:phosphatidylglycerol:prolipoprotein diacylglycerol transferase
MIYTVIAFLLPGGVPVYTFSAILGLATAAGLAWSAWQAPPGRALRLVNAGLWALLGALVGGRAAFVAANWGYFNAHPVESIQVFSGGLSWPGALAGGLLALGFHADLTRQSPGRLADGLLPLAAALSMAVWLACWIDGYAYGPLASWGFPTRDEWGDLARRFPTQLLGAVLVLVSFWLVEQYGKRFHRPGQAACLGLLVLSLEFFALSFLRADPSVLFAGLRQEAWAALAFVGTFGLSLLVISQTGAQASGSR